MKVSNHLRIINSCKFHLKYLSIKFNFELILILLYLRKKLNFNKNEFNLLYRYWGNSQELDFAFVDSWKKNDSFKFYNLLLVLFLLSLIIISESECLDECNFRNIYTIKRKIIIFHEGYLIATRRQNLTWLKYNILIIFMISGRNECFKYRHA